MISIITDCYTEVLEDEERFTMSENQLKGLESTCNFATPLPFEQTAKEILEQQEAREEHNQEEEDEESVDDSNLFVHT